VQRFSEKFMLKRDHAQTRNVSGMAIQGKVIPVLLRHLVPSRGRARALPLGGVVVRLAGKAGHAGIGEKRHSSGVAQDPSCGNKDRSREA
jgi:hypothetical protein